MEMHNTGDSELQREVVATVEHVLLTGNRKSRARMIKTL
jgi:hypothetical protein